VAGVSKAKFKFDDKCRGSIQLKKLLTLPVSDGIAGTGDEVYCMLNFHFSGTCGTFVVRGEISGVTGAQKVKIKINGPAELPGVCPPPPATNFHVTSVECFTPDPGFSAATACTSPPAAGSYTPFASDATQGFCFAASSYVPNSGSFVLAVQGVNF
jgi:hypothetical protein